MDSVVVLSGGTGGAKLARGLLDACDNLTVVANTGDDVDIYGVHVSPDPDLVTYWLADEIDERGWGLRDDSWRVMEAFERAGRPHWFQLGDRDLAMCLLRTERLRAGETLTRAHEAVVDAMGVEARVLPMSDQPVSTWVRVGGRELPFQEFMIVERAEGAIEGVELRGLERARPSDAVLQAVAEAEAIVIGPSNPVISIGPILALPGMREALRAAPAHEGADRALLRAGRCGAQRGRDRPRLRRRDRRRGRRRALGRRGGARDRHAHADACGPRAARARGARLRNLPPRHPLGSPRAL